MRSFILFFVNSFKRFYKFQLAILLFGRQMLNIFCMNTANLTITSYLCKANTVLPPEDSEYETCSKSLCIWYAKIVWNAKLNHVHHFSKLINVCLTVITEQRLVWEKQDTIVAKNWLAYWFTKVCELLLTFFPYHTF